MISKESLRDDKRFYIDDRNIERLYSKGIKRFEVNQFMIGKIYRETGHKIIPLRETKVYKFLNSEDGYNIYNEYCKVDCNGSNLRSVEVYNNLIKQIDEDGYDIRKGAIVIDQFGIILEGQHRSCILLKEYGENHTIDVVQFYMEGFHFKQRIKLFVMKLEGVIRWMTEKK